MNKKFTLFLAALLCLFSAAHAQLCGFDQMHATLKANNPAYSQKVQQTSQQWSQFIQGTSNPNALIINTPNGPVYEIPVVVHVIYPGATNVIGTYNPPDATLVAMVDYLNKSYAATWAAYPSATTGGTAFPIQFTLAKRDPNCNATTGITRNSGSAVAGYAANGINLNNTNGASETTIKALNNWNHNDYYNIWVVNKIDGADGITGSGTYVAGYAYFPGAPASIDGTIMLASKAVAGEITLPHEVGHAFSLFHTFEGDGTGATCPPNANCATDGDMVCDTDPEKRSPFNCPTGTNPCTGVAYGTIVHNFMDYSNCQDRFTAGQRTKWLYSLMNDRPSLISSLGATALPPIGVTAASCIPTITATTNTFDAGVYEVVLNDMTGTSEGGYNDDGAAYLDKTCKQQANLVAGNTYNISVTTGPNAERVRVWIDYNNDGIFSATELVYSHNGTSSYEVHTGAIAIPATGITTCTPLRMRVTSDRTTAAVPTACGPNTYGQTEDYAVRISGVTNASTVAIALTAGTNPSCLNSALTFTATPTGTATGITYKWFVNGVANGITTPTFSSSTLANGSIITARIYYTGACGADSSTSNAITVVRQASIPASVTIALTAGSNPGCPGQSVTFTATPVNGGTAPVYQWKVNGVVQAGQTANTFTTTTLTSGNIVTAVLQSSLSCATPASATSNAITYTNGAQTATALIFIQAGTNPTCAGKPITFRAVVTNGGTAPTYQWLLNGGIVPGATTLNFTTSTLNNLDSVQFLMISNSPCVTTPIVFSNTIKMSVTPNDTPKVTAAITIGSNPGCKDSLLQFTATGTFGSTAPAYAWYVNGVKVANGITYNNTALNNGDVVIARMIASGPGCRSNDTAYSAPITLVITVTPGKPTISFIGTMLVSDSANVQWYGPSGLIPGATGQSYHPSAPGTYYARSISNGCASGNSNTLLISLLSVAQYDLSSVRIYPNPTSGQLVFDWGTHAATTRIAVYSPSGQVVAQDVAHDAFRKAVDLSRLANGVYFVVLKDASGKEGTVRIVLAK